MARLYENRKPATVIIQPDQEETSITQDRTLQCPPKRQSTNTQDHGREIQYTRREEQDKLVGRDPLRNSCRHGNGWRRRARHARRQRCQIAIAEMALALFARRGAAREVDFVGVAVDAGVGTWIDAGAGVGAELLGARLGLGWFGRPPSGHIPNNAGEALELEGLAFPATAGRAAAVKSA